MDNIFIYKIEHNILGVGILPEQSDLNTILEFKIELLIIMEEFYNFNSKSEIEKILQTKDFQQYLSNRNIRFSIENNNKKLEMYQKIKKRVFIYFKQLSA